MTCSERFNIQSEGFIPQLEHCRKIKFSMFIRHSYTQIVNNVERLGDFPTCRKRYYNQSGGGGLYFSIGTLWEDEI